MINYYHNHHKNPENRVLTIYFNLKGVRFFRKHHSKQWRYLHK